MSKPRFDPGYSLLQNFSLNLLAMEMKTETLKLHENMKNLHIKFVRVLQSRNDSKGSKADNVT